MGCRGMEPGGRVEQGGRDAQIHISTVMCHQCNSVTQDFDRTAKEGGTETPQEVSYIRRCSNSNATIRK